MTDTNPHDLLIEHDELLAKLSDVLWDSGLNNAARDVDAAVERLHAYLAQSEPERKLPTRAEAAALYTEVMIANDCQTLGDMAETFSHAILARWGK